MSGTSKHGDTAIGHHRPKQQASQRPNSHFCGACGCLMLSSERQPVRLEPCGHTACGRCAGAAGSGCVIACPDCRASAVRGQPDALLKRELLEFALSTAVVGGEPEAPTSQPQKHQQTPKRSQAQAAEIQLHQPLQQQMQDAGAHRWHQQLEMISARMRGLESTLEQLKRELADITQELSLEVTREKRLRQAEIEAREGIDRLQEELRRLAEQRTASRDAQAFAQSQIEAKKQAIQGAYTAQHTVSMELSKLQTMCGSNQ